MLRSAAMCEQLCRNAFRSGLDAINPDKLVKQALCVSKTGEEVWLRVTDRQYRLDRNLYVAAFGKAAAGMCHAIQTTPPLDRHLVRAVVSMPDGCRDTFVRNGLGDQLPLADSRYEMWEGAVGNIPDANAVASSEAIAAMASGLVADDVLLVLISGGGSALLSLPVAGVSLAEKQTTVRALSTGGATIQQLNTVRQHLSRLKNGRLAQLAAPAQVLSLIISDVVGDDLRFIASGPTFSSGTTAQDALDVISQLRLSAEIPSNVLSHLASHPLPPPPSLTAESTACHVENVIIGSSETALTAMKRHFEAGGFADTQIVGRELTGEAAAVGRELARLVHSLIRTPTERFSSSLLFPPHFQEVGHDQRSPSITADRGRQCLLWGGETTVTIAAGGGRGGRNQELMLQFVLAARRLGLHEEAKHAGVQFAVMSAATDGQDGPTDAAGAVVDRGDVSRLTDERTAAAALLNHDSYDFFDEWQGGRCHLKPGLTGTNVMDVCAVVISRNETE